MHDLLDGRVRSGIRGAAEVLFPENAIGAPDWRSTQMVQRTVDYLDELPPHRGNVVSALFVAADVMLPVALVDVRRLPDVPLAKRRAGFERWYEAPYSALGQIVGALKATLSMVYFNHPDVVRHIGTVKPCARPWDHYEVDVDVDALVRHHRDTSDASDGAGGAS